MYLNQWSKDRTLVGTYGYRFYLYNRVTHEINLNVNTFIGIYEK